MDEARDVTPVFAWALARLLASSAVTDIVESRVEQAHPSGAFPARIFPAIALWDPGVEYDRYAQGGTTVHGVTVLHELAGTSANELRALEAAVVSAYAPSVLAAAPQPDGFAIQDLEFPDEPSDVRVDTDSTPVTFRRVIPLDIDALPVPAEES